MKIINKNIYIIFILLFSSKAFSDYLDYIYSDREPSYNSFGQTGLIHLPTAETHGENSIFFTLTKSEIWKIGTITATPFDWLEASYFYYRPDDLYWGSNLGLYLDKGFNVKFSYKPKNRIFPHLAIGLDDFAGTGRLAREYAVSTYNFKYFKASFGAGWGKFVPFGEGQSNPLGIIHNTFKERPSFSSNYGVGGTPSFDTWFRGDIKYFGGLEAFIPRAKGLKFKIELDPFDYLDFACCGEGASNLTIPLRKKDSNINYGLSMPLKDFGNIEFSFLKGNTWNLSISLGYKLDKNKVRKPKFKPDITDESYVENEEQEFYRDILNNLNRNKLFLQTANIENNTLEVSISSPNIVNPLISSLRAATVAKIVSDKNNYKFDYIDIQHMDTGVLLSSITYKNKIIESFKDTPHELTKLNIKIRPSDPYAYKNHKFKPKVLFPQYFYSFNPDIRTHVGSPEKFLYSGLGININGEIQFSRNLVMAAIIGQSFTDNFDEKTSTPNSLLPHVRTEIVDYLRASDTYLTTLKLEYFWSPKKNVFAKLSTGYFETMFGGIGGEILYKPFNSNLSAGYEIYKVKKRSYEGGFKFLRNSQKTESYSVVTDHINFAYYEPNLNILTKLSYGNYLAGDRGYTLDISRKMPSGLQMGFFFTRTDVPAVIFGEGSFDKGFYFRVPNDLFSKKRSRGSTNLALRSMTRDGGQKLLNDGALIDAMRMRISSRQEIEDWWLHD
jgi:hypothetical protein